MVNPLKIVEDGALFNLVLDNQIVHSLPGAYAILLTNREYLCPDRPQLFLDQHLESRLLHSLDGDAKAMKILIKVGG